MKHSTCVLIALLISSAAVAAPRRVAVVVGIGAYNVTGLSNLSADNDTTKFASVLANNGWTVYLLNSYQEMKSQPNRANILRALGIQESTAGVHYGASDRPLLGTDSLTSADVLLFFYGGHGWPGAHNEGDYILPKDVAFADTVPDTKTLISMNEVVGALRSTKAGSIIVITDACRDATPGKTRKTGMSIPVWSHSVTASATKGKIYETAGEKQQLFFLYSAQPNQLSYEMKTQDSGVFSYFLSAALSPEGSGQALSTTKECVTLTSLFEFTRSSTVNYVQQEWHQAQNPTIDANDLDWPKQFCIAEATSPSPAKANVATTYQPDTRLPPAPANGKCVVKATLPPGGAPQDIDVDMDGESVASLKLFEAGDSDHESFKCTTGNHIFVFEVDITDGPTAKCSFSQDIVAGGTYTPQVLSVKVGKDGKFSKKAPIGFLCAMVPPEMVRQWLSERASIAWPPPRF